MRASGSTSSSRQAASRVRPAGPGRRRPAPRPPEVAEDVLTRPPWQKGSWNMVVVRPKAGERFPRPQQARRHQQSPAVMSWGSRGGGRWPGSGPGPWPPATGTSSLPSATKAPSGWRRWRGPLPGPGWWRKPASMGGVSTSV